jgi:hypothetical protein
MKLLDIYWFEILVLNYNLPISLLFIDFYFRSFFDFGEFLFKRFDFGEVRNFLLRVVILHAGVKGL